MLKKYISHKLCHGRGAREQNCCWVALLWRKPDPLATCWAIKRVGGPDYHTLLWGFESYSGVWVLLWSMNSSFGGLNSYCECNPSLTAGLCSLRLLEASAALRKRYTAKINAQNMILQQTKIRKANGNVQHTKLGIKLGNINKGKGIIDCMDTVKNKKNNWKRNHLVRTSRKPFCPSEGGALLY